MLIVRYSGKEYIFVGDSLEKSGAITTKEAYIAGTAAFCYVGDDGNIVRYGFPAGHVDELEVIGEWTPPDMTEMEEEEWKIALSDWETPDITSLN